MTDPRTLEGALSVARARLQDDADAYSDEHIISMLVEAIERRPRREALEKALDKFQIAAATLDQAWQADDGDAIDNYPDFLPSFDQFVMHVLAMQVRK